MDVDNAHYFPELDNEPFEPMFSQSTSSGLCPSCGTEIESELQNDTEGWACMVDHCPSCGWEGEPYYE